MRPACRTRRRFAGAGSSRIMSMSKDVKSTKSACHGVITMSTNGRWSSYVYFADDSSLLLRSIEQDARLILCQERSEDSEQIQKFTLTRLTVSREPKSPHKLSVQSVMPPE